MRLSEAEWKVMSALWRGHPASVRDLLERLEGEADWAYSTVKTMLGRLVDKGVVRARRRANTLLYEPLLEQERARGDALRELIERAFDGTVGGLVHHLLGSEKLSPRDRRELAALLEREGRDGESER